MLTGMELNFEGLEIKNKKKTHFLYFLLATGKH